jgi:hypothetical protein
LWYGDDCFWDIWFIAPLEDLVEYIAWDFARELLEIWLQAFKREKEDTHLLLHRYRSRNTVNSKFKS